MFAPADDAHTGVRVPDHLSSLFQSATCRNPSQWRVVRGTYALCITVDMIVGVLDPILGSVLIVSLLGAIIDAGAGYFSSHMKKRYINIKIV
ncbi:MAG: hypothetical protein QGG02_16050 [Gammaproteobacteria bacterium]|nr:hypothetical protein [Gammaproteobacteria bacterium]MDP6732992.1 hypothetical protein [Gammaproteobacteria bacterium]